MKISSLKENLEKGKRKTRRKMKEVNRMLVLNEKAWKFRMIKKVKKTTENKQQTKKSHSLHQMWAR